MKNFIFGLTVVLITAFLLLILVEPTRDERDEELPHVKVGKSINLDELVRVGDVLQINNLNSPRIGSSAVLILKPSCFHCEENLAFFVKLKKTFKSKLNVYGVIVSEVSPREATKLALSKKLNFPLYVPKNRDKFMYDLNVLFNLSQTVILDKDIVIFSKSGVLDANDFFNIKNIVKKEIFNET